MNYSQSHNVPHSFRAESGSMTNTAGFDWPYYDRGISSDQSADAPLQEPVPFENFQFSFGLDPNVAIPLPLDIPPPFFPEEGSAPLFDDSLFNIAQAQLPAAGSSAGSLLNEADQRAFSQFLDTVATDQDMQVELLPSRLPDLYGHSYSHHPSFAAGSPNYLIPPSSYHNTTVVCEDDDGAEERRRNILRSLDEQKRIREQNVDPMIRSRASISFSLNENRQEQKYCAAPNSTAQHSSDAVYLRKSDTVNMHYIPTKSIKRPLDTSSDVKTTKKKMSDQRTTEGRRSRPHKELLTEEEKRANHIASEQKRRSTIRSGFKELTDIVPTLKNINNSKSTVLFKAVEYIKYLEKRNKSLREKISALEVRVQVEGRMNNSANLVLRRPQPQRIQSSDFKAVGPQHDAVSSRDPLPHGNDSSNNGNSTMPPGAAAALLAHKAETRNLLQLQEQLQLQQKLIAEQKLSTYHTKGPRSLSNPSSSYHSFSTPLPLPKGFRPVQEESDARMSSRFGNSGNNKTTPRPDTTKTMDVEGTDEPLKATVSA